MDGRVNMNICTYVTPISLKPKQYCIGVYHGTKTLDNLHQNHPVVLQILNKEHLSLVKVLGKKSGFHHDKQTYLEERNLLTQWNEYTVLKGCNAYILLNKISNFKTSGDHEVYVFNVQKSKTLQEDNILMFQDLVNAKIIL